MVQNRGIHNQMIIVEVILYTGEGERGCGSGGRNQQIGQRRELSCSAVTQSLRHLSGALRLGWPCMLSQTGAQGMPAGPGIFTRCPLALWNCSVTFCRELSVAWRLQGDRWEGPDAELSVTRGGGGRSSRKRGVQWCRVP